MSSPIALNIYKINTDVVANVLGEGQIHIAEVPRRLVERYNVGRSEESDAMRPAYRAMTTANQADFARQHGLSFYEKEQREMVTHSWARHFEQVGIDLGDKKTAVPNIVCFAVLGGDLFAITTGSANVVFEPFVDQTFPIEVAKRILDPEVKGGKQQAISGVVQATDVFFRHPTRVSASTSSQDVWQNLSGNVTQSIRQSTEFETIFGARRSVSVAIKSSVKISAKIDNPSQIIALFGWLMNLLEQELTPEQKAAFSFYDAIRPLSTRKDGIIIDKLYDEVVRMFFDESGEHDLSFSHDDTSRFINAEEYELKHGGAIYKEWNDVPTTSDVARAIRDNPIEGSSDREQLEKFQLEAAYSDAPYENTRGNIIRHLNGEVLHEGKIYYLLNGAWFQVDKSYQDLTDTALGDIFEGGLNTSCRVDELHIGNYAHTSEGAYNKDQSSGDLRIWGDTVFYKNLELADIIGTENQGYVDIIHVKRGFNGSVRDAASQVRNAMLTIESDLAMPENPVLSEYYDSLKSRGRISGMTKTDFLGFFRQRSRRYVFAYITPGEITVRGVGAIGSSIAKNEAVALVGFSKQFNAKKTQLQFVHIKDETA